MQDYQEFTPTTLFGEPIKIQPANPKRDLTPAQLKIYNYLNRFGPKSEVQMRKNPLFDDVADIGRALRRMRAMEPPYVDAIPAQKGPQHWVILRRPRKRRK